MIKLLKFFVLLYKALTDSVHGWLDVTDSLDLVYQRERFVQPQIIPASTRHQVTDVLTTTWPKTDKSANYKCVHQTALQLEASRKALVYKHSKNASYFQVKAPLFVGFLPPPDNKMRYAEAPTTAASCNSIDSLQVGCVAQLVERRSLTGELSLFYARPAADGWPLMWVNRPL